MTRHSESQRKVPCCPACGGTPRSRTLSVRGQMFCTCSSCGTLWLPGGPSFTAYTRDYYAARGYDHSSAIINAAKVQTFREFWSYLPDKSGPLLEIGCATGLALRAGLDAGLDVYGFDVTHELGPMLTANGIPPQRISLVNLSSLPNREFRAVACFDSFEHLADPRTFLAELVGHLSPQAYLMMVLPVADSVSRRFLGRFWPHYCVDHWVQYSHKGLETLLGEFRFSLVKTFYPRKYVPLAMIARHIGLHWGRNIPLPEWKVVLRFNVGERGSIWWRNPPRRF